MSPSPTKLYEKRIPDLQKKLVNSFKKGHELRTSNENTLLFFRADDIGVPSDQFERLITLFQQYKMPLCLATVPTWLTSSRLKILTRYTEISSSQWCWHQHGWLHKNHEAIGKKQEFGSQRSYLSIRKDLERGKLRLEKLMVNAFFPIFTPPWNRCGQTTLTALLDLGFQGISRSNGATPVAPSELPDLLINVDLHTRKEHSQEASFKALCNELSVSLAEDCVGIMIHHQLMNDEAFRVLEALLKLITAADFITPVHFRDILQLPP